jgi:lysophospholipase L1-like esterase
MRARSLVLPAVAVAVCAGLVGVREVGASDAVLRRIVTAGDSYAAGTGIHRDPSSYDGGAACLREDDTTPGPRLAADLRLDSTMVACAGAVMADVLGQLATAALAPGGAGEVIALVVGGNDVRTERGDHWTALLTDCILSSGCDDEDGNQLANLDRIERGLTSLHTAVARTYPRATIRVLAYPPLMQRDRWGCLGVVGIGRGEADWIDDQVDALNRRIERAVVAAGASTGADIEFVPVAEEFDNHGACRTWQRDRYVNDARFFDVVRLSPASFHPSQQGYDAFGRALRGSLPTGDSPSR